MAAALLALAWGAVALRDEQPTPPRETGWPAVGARRDDAALRERAWQAWATRDPSVQLEHTSVLFADEWREANRTVVILATDRPSGMRIATVLVDGQQAERFSTRSLPSDARYVTEAVEAAGQAAVVALAPGLTSVVVTTATPGAPRAEEVEVRAPGGVLVPVAAGRTATRIVLKNRGGAVIADRVPGADSSPQTPPAPLILREFVEGERRVQIRSDDSGVTCRVTLLDAEAGDPTLVECPPPA